MAAATRIPILIEAKVCRACCLDRHRPALSCTPVLPVEHRKMMKRDPHMVRCFKNIGFACASEIAAKIELHLQESYPLAGRVESGC